MSSYGNPAIALGVNPPAAPPNPLATLGELAQTQNALNTARQFQQQFAARQAAGQIISQAPDLDTAIAEMKQNPGIAGFLPEILNSYQGLATQSAQTTGVRQANTQNALHEILQSVPQAMTDPASFDATVKARLATVPPELRSSIAPAIGSLKSALFDDLPSDPQARASDYSRRWNAMMLGSGFTPGIVEGIAGRAENLATPQGQVPVVQLPGVLGGARAQAPGYIPNAISPQMVSTPSGAVIPYNPNAGGAQVGGQGARAGTNPLTVAPSAGPEANSPAAAGARAAAAMGRQPTGLGGIPIMSQAEAQQATAMMQDFSTKGAREFGAAQQSLGYLSQMDNDLDTLAKSGGLLTPGAGAQQRLKFANTINTAAQAFGLKPLADPDKVASAEAANKITNTLGFNLVNQFLGGQHEAYGTIEKGIQSVPQIENSYLGSKLLVEGLRQTAQRAIDQREFQQAWAQQRGGNLAGSLEAFNAQFPPEQYAQRALAKYGMTEQGFTSPQAVRQAVSQGYLTKDQAVKILTSQFGTKGRASAGAGGQ